MKLGTRIRKGMYINNKPGVFIIDENQVESVI